MNRPLLSTLARPPATGPAAPPASASRDGLWASLGGFCVLALAMGIGRFAYTALLPEMMAASEFDEATAGIMAAWNYAGYLAGVILARNEVPGLRRYVLLLIALAASVASTAASGLSVPVPALHAIRFVSGLASGASFVLCSAIVLDVLAATGRQVLAGLLYSGVGTGIALGSLASGWLEPMAGLGGAWLGLALLSLPLAGFAALTLHPARLPGQGASRTQAAPAGLSGNAARYRGLLTAYFLEGFGYIVGATFLVALVQSISGSAELGRASWLVTGLAAAVSPPLWRILARKGFLPMLILAFLAQALGTLLPVFASGMSAALASGLLLGGTFMGISVLSLQYGVTLNPRPSAHTVAVMTAVYGIGQILGPFAAGLTAGRGNGLDTAFVISAASLLAAVLVLMVSHRKT